ncbi:MAG: tyrosine--tRNA ligase [SAR202 cluster bacterium]|nr:tyrosine--tRNA ligase [SAR202 cluster bacterium]|tara:strand:- start:16307 stop:17536 length:1230 start_codon:yes stop_codon:yes gene_type:complete
MMPSINPIQLENILHRGVTDIIVESEFVRLLEEGKPLRLKMGFDPSRPDIHLGHAVGLRKLRELQDIGHQVVLIVGDWTAQIGDPSGQSATRQMLSAEEVRENAQTYLTQFFKVVDKSKTETVWQSEWFGKFTLDNVFDLTRRFTVAQFLARDDFANRYNSQQPIAITELLYPLLQAYDSVAINSDVEFGGSDQRFNLLVGRDLQGMLGQRQQQCFIMPLLVGTDGVQKMSKSLNNYIGVDEPPSDMYGKIMSIPDHLIMSYLELTTSTSKQDLNQINKEMQAESVNPMDIKKMLARDIVSQFHDESSARESELTFVRTVQQGNEPEDIKTLLMQFTTNAENPNKSLTINFVDLITAEKLVNSKSEAKRLISQSAVSINGVVSNAETNVIQPNDIIRVGRRRFLKIVEG